ncbi:MAG: 23S rRNA (guanosine(2251)-2'-O)-methyltransferase RlmB [Candidatus Zhuqueibacterota bacterium]
MEQLEGKISVEAALTMRQRKISIIIIRSGMHAAILQPIVEAAETQSIPIKYVSRQEIDAMAHGKTHGGIIALAAAKPPLAIDSLLDALKTRSTPSALLLLEGIDDAQNFGFTLRSAEALGIDAVLLKKHVWDFDGAAISRASSGAFERMPCALLDQSEKILPKFKSIGFQIIGCIANAKRAMYEADLTQPVIIAIGGEKRGLSAAVRSQCNTFIKIPMKSATGSLSLSHSASIIMAELMRQRFGAEKLPPAIVP